MNNTLSMFQVFSAMSVKRKKKFQIWKFFLAFFFLKVCIHFREFPPNAPHKNFWLEFWAGIYGHTNRTNGAKVFHHHRKTGQMQRKCLLCSASVCTIKNISHTIRGKNHLSVTWLNQSVFSRDFRIICFEKWNIHRVIHEQLIKKIRLLGVLVYMSE